MIYTVHSRYLEARETLGPDSTTVMRAPGQAGGVPAGTRGVVIPRISKAVRLARRFTREQMLQPYFSRFAWDRYGKLPCPRRVFDELDAPEARWLVEWAERAPADPMFRDESAMIDTVCRHVQRYLIGAVEYDPMLSRLKSDLSLLNMRDIREHFRQGEGR